MVGVRAVDVRKIFWPNFLLSGEVLTGHTDCPRPVTYFTWDLILCTTKRKLYESLVNTRKQYNIYTILTLEFMMPIVGICCADMV